MSSHISCAFLNYLPSKKFIITALGVAVLVFASWYVFLSSPDSAELAENQTGKTAINTQFEAVNKDSDGDGLKDWEELLWKTDPLNPDTNGDGMGDKEETLLNSNKTLRPVNDTEQNNSLANNEENLTQRIAEDFGTAYLTRKLVPNNSDSEAPNLEGLEALVFSDIKKTITQTAETKLPDKYSASDIKILAEASQSATRTYINTIGKIITNAPHEPEKSEMEILEEVITKEDLKPLAGIGLHSENYRYFTEKIKDVPVLEVFKDAHLALINTFWRLHLITADMARLDQDPIKSIAAISQYDQEIKNSLEPLGIIIDAIKNGNIEFSEGEGGIIFSKYVVLRK
ncbi:MAG: hypothetical protein Q8R36_01345 [bacterium]|nr:hypothetical protein [bacterium]